MPNQYRETRLFRFYTFGDVNGLRCAGTKKPARESGLKILGSYALPEFLAGGNSLKTDAGAAGKAAPAKK